MSAKKHIVKMYELSNDFAVLHAADLLLSFILAVLIFPALTASFSRRFTPPLQIRYNPTRLFGRNLEVNRAKADKETTVTLEEDNRR